jgi:hypothetical protein
LLVAVLVVAVLVVAAVRVALFMPQHKASQVQAVLLF